MKKCISAFVCGICSILICCSTACSFNFVYEVEGTDIISGNKVYGQVRQISDTALNGTLEYSNGTEVSVIGEFCGMGRMRFETTKECFIVDVVE